MAIAVVLLEVWVVEVFLRSRRKQLDLESGGGYDDLYEPRDALPEGRFIMFGFVVYSNTAESG